MRWELIVHLKETQGEGDDFITGAVHLQVGGDLGQHHIQHHQVIAQPKALG